MIYRVDQSTSLTPYGDHWCDNAYAYLSNYLDIFTHEMGTTDMGVNGLFTFRISTRQYPSLSLILNDGTVVHIAGGGDMNANRPFRFTLISSENFFFFSMNRDYGGHLVITWCRDSSGKYYVGGAGDMHTLDTTELYKTDGSMFTLYDITDTTSYYTFKQLFNFKAPPGKIALARFQPLSTVGNLTIVAEDLYTCSTVPYRSTVSIMGDTFLAVDTNTLIKLDLED